MLDGKESRNKKRKGQDKDKNTKITNVRINEVHETKVRKKHETKVQKKHETKVQKKHETKVQKKHETTAYKVHRKSGQYRKGEKGKISSSESQANNPDIIRKGKKRKGE